MLTRLKITKIERNRKERRISVYTDRFVDIGYGFDIDDIADKADLKLKLKQRVNVDIAKETDEKIDETKYDNLKTLIGDKI